MAVYDIAIEIGTSYTSIYMAGSGLVLREPTVIAFVGDDDKKSVLAVGYKADKMRGRVPEKTTVVTPVSEGYIADKDACAKLMTEFIKKILPASYIIFPRIRAILVVPTGLSVDERRMYEDVVRTAGVYEITLIDKVLATALGFDIPINKPIGGLVANIGGGGTEIAIVSMCATITGCFISVGGDMMDKAIVDFVMGKYALKISLETAREIKEEIGSLYPNDVSSMVVKGMNMRTMTPASLSVYATDVYEALLPFYTHIAETIRGTTNLCPTELASSLHGLGLFLCGGGAKMPGIERVFAQQLDLPITVSDESELCTVLGAGKLLGNKEMLEEIRKQQ